MDSKRARIGVIGTGWWATRVHLPALQANADCEVIAVADRDTRRAELVAEHFDIPGWFTDFRDLLSLQPDGVVVVTPHDTHFPIARACLLAGVDVLVEKPMVVDPAHGHELVQIVSCTGRHLHVGYPYPHVPLARSLRDLVVSGRLGTIRLVNGTFATAVRELYHGRPHVRGEDALFLPEPGTYNDPRRGGGQAQSQLTHLASLLFFITGAIPHEAYACATGECPDLDIWDAITFRDQTGMIATLASAGSIASGMPTVERLEIFGDKGHAIYDLGAGKLSVQFYDGTRVEEVANTEAERYPRAAPSKNLIDTILGRAPVLVDCRLGSLTADFLAAVLASSRSHRPVQVKGECHIAASEQHSIVL